MTAWDDSHELIVRSINPKIIADKAKDLVSQGMRVTIVRTSSGESLTVHELEELASNASPRGPLEAA